MVANSNLEFYFQNKKTSSPQLNSHGCHISLLPLPDNPISSAICLTRFLYFGQKGKFTQEIPITEFQFSSSTRYFIDGWNLIKTGSKIVFFITNVIISARSIQIHISVAMKTKQNVCQKRKVF